MSWTRSCAITFVLLLAACAETPLLALELVTPEGGDPLLGASEVRLVVTNPGKEASSVLVDPQTLDLGLEVDVAGEVGQVVLEAYSGSSLLARGETPSFTMRPVDDAFALLVGRAGAFSTLTARLSAPRSAMLVAHLPARGYLVAGGHDAAGVPSAAAMIYDYWNQEPAQVPLTLPEPRAEGVALTCGSGCALLALGRNAEGLAQTMLSYNAGWAQLPDGLDAASRRRRAVAAALDDGSYLVVGGLDAADQAQRTMLRIWPGEGIQPTMTPLTQPALAARDEPAVASTGLAVVVVGGQAAGDPVGEVVYPESEQSVELVFEGSAPLSGTAALLLPDGKVAVVGGRDQAGDLLADGWLIDPSTRKVTRVANALAVPRAGHQLLLVYGQVVVVGGEDGSGAIGTFEVLSASLRPLGRGEAAAVRQGACAAPIGAGSFVLFGGLDGAGNGVEAIEIFETAQPFPL